MRIQFFDEKRYCVSITCVIRLLLIKLYDITAVMIISILKCSITYYCMLEKSKTCDLNDHGEDKHPFDKVCLAIHRE